MTKKTGRVGMMAAVLLLALGISSARAQNVSLVVGTDGRLKAPLNFFNTNAALMQTALGNYNGAIDISGLIGNRRPAVTYWINPDGTEDFTSAQTALESITDSSANKIYELRVRPSTNTYRIFNVGLPGAQYVNIVGENPDTTIFHFTDAGATGTNDTITAGGCIYVEGVTFIRETTAGSADYPGHIDSDAIALGTVTRSVWAFNNCKFEARGAVGGSAFGLGTHSGEVGYFVRCTFIGKGSRAFNGHDENGTPADSQHVYFIGCTFSTTASTPNNIGLYWARLSDNTTPSYVTVVGGSATGTDAGISIANGTSSGNTYVTVGYSVNVTGGITSANAKWLSRGNPVIPRAPEMRRTNFFTGAMITSRNGISITDSIIRPYAAATTMEYHHAGPGTNTFSGVPSDANYRLTVVGNSLLTSRNSGTTLGVGRGATTPLTQLHVVGGGTAPLSPHPSIDSTEMQVLIESTHANGARLGILSTNNGIAGVWFGDNDGASVVELELDNATGIFEIDNSVGPSLFTKAIPSGGASPGGNTVVAIRNSGTTALEFISRSTDTQQILFSDNANSVGAISFSHSSGNMSLNVGGSTSMTLADSGNNVGIGTTAPNRKFEVVDSAGAQGRLTHTAGSIFTDLRTDASNHFSITTTNNGNIVLTPHGTGYTWAQGTAPQIRLFGPSGAGYAQFYDSGSGTNGTSDGMTIGYNGGGIINVRESAGLTISTTDIARMTVAAGGNIGIGTTGPDSPLDILKTDGPQLRLTHTDSSVFATLRADASGHLLIAPSGNHSSFTGTASFSGDQIRILTDKTPSSAADTGVAGSLCFDNDFGYFATGTDTWKRFPISTWP